jgi:ATP-dependent DNA helicase RecQ
LEPKEALLKYFGYSSFRQNQLEIITAIIRGENVLSVLPTGAGKSICYQIPALISPDFSIVISPLIALMKDQVDSLNKIAPVAAFINSTLSFYETEEVLKKISFGEIKLLYVAPERLESIEFADRIKSLNPSYLFVDEAHCISEWGHSFRPSYTKIKDFIQYISVKKISGFTATATPEVVKDIVEQLGLKEPKLFVRGFERENLALNVVLTKKKKEKCLELISRFKTPAIIYTASRKRAEEISDYLNMHKVSCNYYHAGLSSEERKKIQEDFIEGRIPVIAATNAFGMGIDKKNIRLVIHYNTPGSIENYYQEIGRAGRDGKTSYVYLLHDDSDINIQNFFLANSHPDKALIQNIYDAICDYGQVAVGNMPEKEIHINPEYISAYVKREVSRGLLYSALRILEGGGYLRQASEFDNQTKININVEKNKLKEFIKRSSNTLIKIVVLYLLREYGSKIFIKPVQISISQTAVILSLTEKEVEDTFTTLDNLGIISFFKPISKDNVLLISPRISSNRLVIDYKKINESYISMQRKIDRMVDYVYSDNCRFKFILNYFGENIEDYNCNKCDNCKSQETIPESSANYIKEILLRTFYTVKSSISETAVISTAAGTSKLEKYKCLETFGACANYNKNDIKLVLHNLIEKDFIEKNEKNKLFGLSEKGLDFLKDNDLIKDEFIEQPMYEVNLELFNLLKEVRKKASKKFMQTGYLICPDEILKKISSTHPKTKTDLLMIDGFNNRMFNKLGIDILEAVKEFEESKKANSAKTKKELRTIPSNIQETFRLLTNSYSLKDIASLRKLSEAVVSMQIETILEYKNDVDVNHLFKKDELETIIKEIEKGYTDLKDLKEKLPDNITYPLIRIAVAKYKSTSHSFY